jgi:chemotaxis signal transduction protein
MKRENVNGIIVSEKDDKILIMDLLEEGIRIFYWDKEEFQEASQFPKVKTLAEGVSKAEKEIAINLEYTKLCDSEEFDKLSSEETEKIEDDFNRRLAEIWA